MIVLAIESSSHRGGLAVVDDQGVTRSAALDPAQRTAQAMAPALQRLLSDCELNVKDIDLVAVTAGPGSFTGLRVGVTTAKCFAYAANTRICEVNTLRLLADQAPVSDVPVVAVLDAQRSGVLFATHEGHDASLRATMPTQVVDLSEFESRVPTHCILTGTGIERLDRAGVAGGLPRVPKENWEPTATALGTLAFQAALSEQSGRKWDGVTFTDDPFSLVPRYYRKSAAEEKAEGKT